MSEMPTLGAGPTHSVENTLFASGFLMNDLQKFEEKHKKSLIQAIGSHLFSGLEELINMLGFGKKPHHKHESSSQISIALDKYENKLILGKK